MEEVVQIYLKKNLKTQKKAWVQNIDFYQP